MTARRVIALALCITGIAGSVSAQSMRAFRASRNIGAERQLRASIEFGAGEVQIRPAGGNELYDMSVKYDAERYAPVQQYEPRTGILRLGLESIGKGGVRVSSRKQLTQTAVFELSARLPLALTANLGASDATLELGGLMLSELTVASGASRGVVSFARPTVGACNSASFHVGATELSVLHLANAGCREVELGGGVGSATLDFTGQWRRDAHVSVELSMGTVKLRIPRGTALRIEAERFLSPINADGLTKDGTRWSTPNFDAAARKIVVELKAAMVGVTVEWVR